MALISRQKRAATGRLGRVQDTMTPFLGGRGLRPVPAKTMPEKDRNVRENKGQGGLQEALKVAAPISKALVSKLLSGDEKPEAKPEVQSGDISKYLKGKDEQDMNNLMARTQSEKMLSAASGLNKMLFPDEAPTEEQQEEMKPTETELIEEEQTPAEKQEEERESRDFQMDAVDDYTKALEEESSGSGGDGDSSGGGGGQFSISF